ncbi:MAG: nucleotidyltransferase family protein [Betaproteobacteria bacterium]|nr:nucleotidyltransferase family protein [Betaproteobacteria bacterium]
MILAAGVGERMRPLTDRQPKPMLEAGGKPLIQWLIERLVAAGWTELVINLAHLGMQIEHYLGDGRALGASIAYSREPAPLETAGGIATALPLLGEGPFLTVNGDLYCDYPFAQLRDAAQRMGTQGLLGHLVLVNNPAHHPEGDFALREGRISATGAPRYTFSGIGLYDSKLFADTRAHERAKLAPLLFKAAAIDRLSGEIFQGEWRDIGTPDRLAALDRVLKSGNAKNP